MQIHNNAATNMAQRTWLQQDKTTPVAKLANQLKVSQKTIRKWRLRDFVEDKSSRPSSIQYSLDAHTQRLIRHCREHQLPLDSIWQGLAPYIPKVNRTNTYRTLNRLGLSRLPSTKRITKDFKTYPPGFIHIDWFYLPSLGPTRRYCIVAIDRATRWLVVGFYDHMDKTNSMDFMQSLVEKLPFHISIVLSDNGSCFTNNWYTKQRGGAKHHSDFTALLASIGIEHRLTKIRHPWTNGLVENTNKQIKYSTVKRYIYCDYEEAEAGIRAYVLYHNLKKRHRGLGWKTSTEAMLDWRNKDPTLFTKDSNLLVRKE